MCSSGESSGGPVLARGGVRESCYIASSSEIRVGLDDSKQPWPKSSRGLGGGAHTEDLGLMGQPLSNRFPSLALVSSLPEE